MSFFANHPEVNTVGLKDKADAAKDKIAGKIKEGTGKLTGDQRTEAEGQGQQLQGKAKDGAEQVKDTARDVRDRAKGFTEGLQQE